MTDKWISVEERFPEPMQKILVWVEDVNQWIKHQYTGKRWRLIETIILPKYYEVRIWMPLPEPPKQ